MAKKPMAASFGIRRLRSAAAAVVALAALTITVPAALPAGVPEAAAAPICTGTANILRNGDKATLPANGGSFDCILGLGNQGDGVRYLQYSLIFCNHADTGGLDGHYGPKTRDAIAWIQGANGLPVDGVYGKQTRRVMQWLFSSGKCGLV